MTDNTSAGLLANELERIGDVIHDIADRSDDEGDRVYFGSANDPHALVRQARYLHKAVERLRQSAAPASEAGERVFCNKCGFHGTAAFASNHNRPDGSRCPYVAVTSLSRPPESAETVELLKDRLRYIAAFGCEEGDEAGAFLAVKLHAMIALAKLDAQGGAGE